MKKGDLVKLKNLHEEWGKVGLITRILHTSINTGQIYLFANGTYRTIPWLQREKYMEVINESR